MTWTVDAQGAGAGTLGRLFGAIYNRNLDRAIPNLQAEMRSTPDAELALFGAAPDAPVGREVEILRTKNPYGHKGITADHLGRKWSAQPCSATAKVLATNMFW